MRMITVYVDLIGPLYWWKEFDTYKVGTVANSCSTMHKIAAKEFSQEDFSREHLFGPDDMLKWDERKRYCERQRFSGCECGWKLVLLYAARIYSDDLQYP